MTEWTIGAGDAGTRLDKFLAGADRLGSRGKAAAALERGKIYVNGEEALMRDASRALVEGDHVRFWVDRPGSAKSRPRVGITDDLDVIYEDSRLIVVNKPAGLLSVPLERNPGIPSVYDQIEERFRPFGKMLPLVVHRIDQDTSGLVVFAKDEEAQMRLKEQFKRREPERIYRAVVYGTPDPAEGTWRDHLAWDEKRLIQKQTHPKDPRASEAISYYRTVELLRGTTLIEVKLGSGRRNQVRIQARLRGHTLVGERRYVFGPDSLRPIAFPRHALHAYRLAFRHPEHGGPLEVVAEPPADFRDLISRLRLKASR